MGTAQDCVDYHRLRHHEGYTVVASTLGKCFLPWTVTRSAWVAALRPRVSGIATDVMLFSQHGARLIQRYRVFADSVPHQSLCGLFKTKLSGFTQASAEARSAAKHGRDFSAESTVPRWRLLLTCRLRAAADPEGVSADTGTCPVAG